MKFSLNFKHFKKVGEDKHTTTLQHPAGHQIKIAHSALSPEHAKQIRALPMVESKSQGGYDGKAGFSTNAEKSDKFYNEHPAGTGVIGEFINKLSGSTPSPSPAPENKAKGGKVEQNQKLHPDQPTPTPNPAYQMLEDQAGPKEDSEGDGLNGKPGVNLKFAQGGMARKMYADGTPDSGASNSDAAPIAEDVGLQMPALGSQYSNGSEEPTVRPDQSLKQPESPSLGDAMNQVESVDNQEGQVAQSPMQIGGPQDPYGFAASRGMLQAGFKNQMAGVQNEQKAESAQAKAMQPFFEETDKALKDSFNKVQTYIGNHQQDYQNFVTDMQNQHIDPNHLFSSESTAGKIGTTLGLILGGIGSGLTHGPNMALDTLNKMIDRDIDAQKFNIGNKFNLYNANLQQYQNNMQAQEMTRNQLLGAIGFKAQALANASKDPMAIARSQQLIGQIQAQVAPSVSQMGAQQAAMSMANEMNGATGQVTEGGFVGRLNALKQLQSPMAKDFAERYIPGVGVAQGTPAKGDIESFKKFNDIDDLTNKAIALQKSLGNNPSWAHLPSTRQDIASLKDQLQVSLNELYGLGRLNENEYKNYASQLGSFGESNLFGSAAEGLKNIKQLSQIRRKNLMESLNVKPFAGTQVKMSAPMKPPVKPVK